MCCMGQWICPPCSPTLESEFRSGNGRQAKRERVLRELRELSQINLKRQLKPRNTRNTRKAGKTSNIQRKRFQSWPQKNAEITKRLEFSAFFAFSCGDAGGLKVPRLFSVFRVFRGSSTCPATTPVGLDQPRRETQGSRRRQPWALGLSPVGAARN